MSPVPVVFHQNPALIGRVRDEWGALSNMSAHPIQWGGMEWPRAEHLFQAWRFAEDSPVRELIRSTRNPMTVKIVARTHKDQMVFAPRTPEDLQRMRLLLRLKRDQHEELQQLVRATGDRPIVEDCTKRASESGLFWGSALLRDGQSWKGWNHLGRLWMELRSEQP